MKKNKVLCIGPLADQVVDEFAPEFELVEVDESSREEALAEADEDVVLIIARGSVVVDEEIIWKAPN